MNREATARSARPVDPAGDALNRRLQVPGRRLFVGGERSVRKTLMIRAAMVLIMFALVISVFWFDRDGLRDNHDGSISFSDVVYFTMVSVTTVGYGDVVPKTAEGRIAASALMLLGIGLFSAVTAIITSFMLDRGRRDSDPIGDLERLVALARAGGLPEDELAPKRAELLARI